MDAARFRRAIRIPARLIVALTFVTVAALLVAWRIGPEHWWPSALALYLPYPVHLLAAGLGVLASLALGWRWRLAALATLALVLGPVMGLELHAGESAEPGSPRLRVMTYNVKSYRTLAKPDGLGRLVWEVALHDADIVVMQEASELAAVLEKEPALRTKMFGDRQVQSRGQYLVASRHPLRDCRPGVIPFREYRHTYLHCTVNAHGTDIALYSVHLLTPRGGLNAARHEALGGVDEWEQNVDDRMEQVTHLAQDLTEEKLPVILAGDLNAPGYSLVLRALFRTGLRDAHFTAGTGYDYTWGHSLRPGISFLRLDHVLVGPEFAVAGSQVGTHEASEHRPVIADLFLRR